MPPLEHNWFSEIHENLWPGRALSLRMDRVLYQEKSEYQDICVFENSGVGRVLTLDNIIQITESDEFAYQEMIAHVPLFAHPDPRSVLIIGGGDGGVAREVAKHRGVEQIDLCEIDRMVIEVSRKYLPFTSVGFSDPRVKVHIQDGAEFARKNVDAYDVIIVDSSDPIGPAKVLFEEPFYRSIEAALKKDGIMMNQAESIWLHLDLIKDLRKTAEGLFPKTEYCYTCVPTYPSGQIGFLCCSKEYDVREPQRRPDQAFQKKCRYYTPDIHKASFHLPAFVNR
ncbi:MAG: spermidine synthase [Deltaproteobacteria bacterium]|nr:spermidine synthase [Deltaproteobacteria bacterium]